MGDFSAVFREIIHKDGGLLADEDVKYSCPGKTITLAKKRELMGWKPSETTKHLMLKDDWTSEANRRLES